MIAGVTGLGVGLGLLGALTETLESLSSIVGSITVVAAAGAVVGFPFQALILVGVLSHAAVAGIMLRGWQLSPRFAGAPDNLTMLIGL